MALRTKLFKCLQRVGAVVVVVALLPVALATGIWHRIRGGANTDPGEFAEILRRAAQDCHPYWDLLECVNIQDTRLEALRQEALKVRIPLTPDGRSTLIELALQAEKLGETKSAGDGYVIPFHLYSRDGKRRVEVRVRPSERKAYFVDQELLAGEKFTNCGSGEEIGPYETPKLAEAAAIARPWFSGHST